MKNQKSIFAVSSSGGHYSELKEFLNFIPKSFKIFIFRDCLHQNTIFSKIIFSEEGNLLNISISAIGRNKWRAFNTFLIGSYLLIKERPSFLITTGAGIGTIFCILCRILLIPSIFICSPTHIKKIGLSCIIARFFANEFYVRHENLAKKLNCYYFPNDAIR